MNLDELVCGALESSFWAMDRKEIYNGPTTHASHQGHSDLFTQFDRFQTRPCYEYRVSHLVADLGWVDLDLGCPTTLPGQ